MGTATNAVESVNKGGRPTKYHDRLLPQVRKLAKTGATELEIADCLNVTHNTLVAWCSQYPRFLSALELGKKQANKRVARALFHRAVGYTHESVKVFNDKGEPMIVPIREHVPPDINAVKFWLTNRDPEAWQDRTGVDITGNLSVIASTVSAARTRLLTAKANVATIEAQLEPDTTEVVESE